MPGDQSEMATRTIEENTAAGKDVGVPVEAGDGDDDILTYTLDAGDVAFDIDQATGQIKTKAGLDFDTTPSYTVTVTATDPGSLNDSIEVTIMVTDVNEPPDITGDVDDYDENGLGTVATFGTDDPEEAGTVTLDLSGTDAALFDLSEGVLTFTGGPPNYEKPGDADKDNTYELTVGAKDDDGIRGTRDVEVKVANVNEEGTVTLSAVQPRVGVPLTASVTDIDGPVTGVKWQWSIGNSEIEDATSDTYTPVAADVEVISDGYGDVHRPPGCGPPRLRITLHLATRPTPWRRTPGTRRRRSLLTRTWIPRVTRPRPRGQLQRTRPQTSPWAVVRSPPPTPTPTTKLATSWVALARPPSASA